MCSKYPQSVFITGANRGIGFEMVKQLTELKEPPKYIFATYRNVDGAKELFELSEKVKSVRPIQLDVRDFDSYEKIVAEVSSVVGNDGLNCLVNNAGILVVDGLNTMTKDDVTKLFEVNAVARLFLTRAFVPLLRKGFENSSGTPFTWYRSSVVNVTSVVGTVSNCTVESLNSYPYNTNHGIHSYRISTAALNMVTRLLSIDLNPDNILVVGVDPNWVATDMGGVDGIVKPSESVSTILSTLEKLAKAENGGLLNYDGTLLLNY